MTKVKTATKKTSKKAAKKVETAKVEKGETIGAFTKACILSGMAVKEVVAAIQAKFPECGPQINSVYFYRSQLHKSGELKKA